MEIQEADSRPKLSKRRNRLMQAAIMVAAYGFIYHQVFSEHGSRQLTGLIWQFTTLGNEKALAAIILGLMFLNWGIEAAKWKYLIDRIEEVSFLQAIKAVLTGITISTFTPNRIGEYFGRAFILKKAHPIEAIILTIVGSMSQLLVTFLAGTTALLFLLPQLTIERSNWPRFVLPGLIVLSILVNAAFIFIYLNIGAIRPIIRYFLRRHWRKYYRYISILSHIRPAELAKILLLSIFRYAIFFSQFYIALHLFSVRLSLKEAMMLLPVIYLTLAIVPTVALTELGVRGSVAIYVISTYLVLQSGTTENLAPSILSAATLIWIVNLAFPAVIGTLFVFNLRFFRR
jgi:hypothetical protein